MVKVLTENPWEKIYFGPLEEEMLLASELFFPRKSTWFGFQKLSLYSKYGGHG
uniref:Uncharacterized protein n=1 Tax=Vitis vinifera TaxID=29760 RepID=F6GY75_VITVI